MAVRHLKRYVSWVQTVWVTRKLATRTRLNPAAREDLA